MRMRPEDVEYGMNKTPDGVHCLHSTEVIVLPTPDGFMYALRTVSHGDPGENVTDDSTVRREDVLTQMFGMNESDLIQLASEVHAALAFASGIRGSAN